MSAAALLALLLVAGPAATRKLAPTPAPVTASDLLAHVKDERGKVVLVNAWATWCLPCRKEMPDMLRLRKDLGPQGFELVLVTADFADAILEARAFLAESGADFPTFHKKQGDQDFIDGLDPAWSGALPFTMLFDRNGQRVASWEGREPYEKLIARIRPLIDSGAKQ